MKQKLSILVIVLSLLVIFSIKNDQQRLLCDNEIGQLVVYDNDMSFLEDDSLIDLNGRIASSTTLTLSQSITNNVRSKRNTLNTLPGVTCAIANLFSERSYSYSCEFPFQHKPFSGLFLILRNIRI